MPIFGNKKTANAVKLGIRGQARAENPPSPFLQRCKNCDVDCKEVRKRGVDIFSAQLPANPVKLGFRAFSFVVMSTFSLLLFNVFTSPNFRNSEIWVVYCQQVATRTVRLFLKQYPAKPLFSGFRAFCFVQGGTVRLKFF